MKLKKSIKEKEKQMSLGIDESFNKYEKAKV